MRFCRFLCSFRSPSKMKIPFARHPRIMKKNERRTETPVMKWSATAKAVTSTNANVYKRRRTRVFEESFTAA